jgi:hypothetical protein
MTEKAPQTTAEIALRVAERFGVPVVLLVVLLWMIREAATSLNGTVVVPIVKSHTEFLDTTRETLTEISRTQLQQADTMKEIAENQKELKIIVTSREGDEGGK